MNNKEFQINILGSEWTVTFHRLTDNKLLEEIEGICDESTREIFIRDYGLEYENKDKGNWKAIINKTLRHEIIHAFMFESGLGYNSNETTNWAINEEMIDWFAIQSPKIFKVFEELEIL